MSVCLSHTFALGIEAVLSQLFFEKKEKIMSQLKEKKIAVLLVDFKRR